MKKFITLALGAAALILGVAIPSVADTTTSRFGLTLPSIGSYGWPQKTNANWEVLDSSAASQYKNNIFVATNTFNQPVYLTNKLSVTGTAFLSAIQFADGTVMTSTSGFAGGGGSDPTKLPLTGGTLTGQLTVSGASVTVDGANIGVTGGGQFQGSGAGLSSLPASSLTGTVPNASLDQSSVTKQGNAFNAAGQLLLLDGSAKVPNANLDQSSVTKQGNTFNGAGQLVQLNGSGQLPALSATNLTSLPAANLSGTVPNASLDQSSVTKQGNAFNGANQLVKLDSGALVPNANLDQSSVTKQGNAFNGANQLVKLDGTGKLPAVDGSQLTGIAAGGSSSLAVGTGTAAGFGVAITTPTAAINFDKDQFTGQLTGSGTAYIRVNVSSITAQGNTFNGANQLLQADSGGKLATGNLPSDGYASTYVNATGDTMSGQLTVQSSATFTHNAFSVGGSTLAVTLGKVGIGTSNPSNLLSLAGTNTPTLSLFESGGSITAVMRSVNGALGYAAFGTSSNNGVAFIAGESTRAFITATGSFGIGTTSPGSYVQVSTTAGTGGGVFSVSTGPVDLFRVSGSSVALKVPLYFPDGTSMNTASTGGGTPAGSNGHIQINTAGVFGSDAALTFNTVSKLLSVTSMTVIWVNVSTVSANQYLGGGTGLWQLFDPTVGRTSWTSLVGGSTTIFRNDGIQWIGGTTASLGASGNASQLVMGSTHTTIVPNAVTSGTYFGNGFVDTVSGFNVKHATIPWSVSFTTVTNGMEVDLGALSAQGAATITRIDIGTLPSGTTGLVQLDYRPTTNITSAGTNVFTVSYATGTSPVLKTYVAADFANPVVPQFYHLFLKTHPTTAQTGGVTNLGITIYYKEQ
jgi:hypothetical protein